MGRIPKTQVNLHVDGHAANIGVSAVVPWRPHGHHGWCNFRQGVRSMSVSISDGPDTANEISACLVGPDFAANEARLRALVRSILFTKQ
jgi:hypothetical protein